MAELGKGQGVNKQPGVGRGAVVVDLAYALDTVLTRPSYSVGSSTYEITQTLSALLYRERGETAYQLDALVKKNIALATKFDMVLVSPTVAQSMDMRLVLSPSARIPKKPVITVLLDSWKQSLDLVWMKVQTMSYAMKIENAESSELDHWWGEVYGQRRLSLESDSDYRKRLQNYANVLKGSGTKGNVEEIIDNIIGVEGATTLTTYWPATVEITFNDSGDRAAKARQSLLEYMLPYTLAAGVSFRMALPFLDYYMDLCLCGDNEYRHTIDMRLGVPTLLHRMNMLLSMAKNYELHQMDLLILGDVDFTYQVSIKLMKICETLHTMDSLTFKNVEKTYALNALVSKKIDIDYYINLLLTKEVTCPLSINTILQTNFIQSQRMDIIVV